MAAEPLLPDKQTILVTGASGFIGSYLCRFLQHRGYGVRPCGLARSAEEIRRKTELEAAGLKFVEADIARTAEATSIATGATAIIHLAAAQHEADQPERYFFEINCGGTQNLLDAAAQTGVERFVYVSTIGVFGTGAKTRLSESSAPSPNNAYGRSKLAAEKIVLSYAGGLNTTVIRLAEVYGDGDPRLLKLFRAARARHMIQVGDGSNLHQPVHVDDVASGLTAALRSDHCVGETGTVAGNELVTTADMLKIIADTVGNHVRTIRIPLAPMRGACIAFETVFGLVGRTPPLHRRRLEFFTKNLTFDTAKSRSALGFSPRIDFAAGCRRTADWYRDHGLLN